MRPEELLRTMEGSRQQGRDSVIHVQARCGGSWSRESGVGREASCKRIMG